MTPKDKKQTAVIISSQDIDDDEKLDKALDDALDALFGPDEESDQETDQKKKK